MSNIESSVSSASDWETIMVLPAMDFTAAIMASVPYGDDWGVFWVG